MSEKQKEIKPVPYSQEELNYRADLIKKLDNARNLRDRKHPELDDMTYVEYHESNRKKDLSYIPPKTNKQDIRIVTGTTREKDTSLLSTLLNLNLEPDITAFDTDNMVVAELGDNMTDIVKKTRESEMYYQKRPIIYRELIHQGDVFVEEVWTEDFRKIPLSELKWDPTKDKVAKLDFKERLEKVFCGCEAKMIDGRKVYLFDIRKEYINQQPGVAIMNVYHRSEAKAKYGNWERWEYVPDEMSSNELITPEGGKYQDWNLMVINKDQVAEVKVWLPYENRFMIFLNGVMMLPINYPLTAISPSGEIPIAQGKLEPISGFAYSKSFPSKTKVDQEVLDEMTKLMVEAMRQTRKPPMGNTTKKVFGSNIFLAGRVTSDIKKDQLFPLLQNQQIQNSEFSLYQLIKSSIDEKSINPNFEGNSVSKNQTATEIVEMKNQQMQKLGLAMDGVINLERAMTWHRIYNFIANGTKLYEDESSEGTGDSVVDSLKAHMSVETTLDNGEKGIKMFRFDADNSKWPSVGDQEQEEYDLKKKYRQPVKIVYLNPKLLRAMKMIWFIIINPTPKSNDKLSQILFVQNITTAANLFGLESLNLDYIKQRYAILMNEDYNKMFKKMDVMAMLQQGMRPDGKTPGQGQGKQVGAQDAMGGDSRLKAVME